MDEEEEKNIIQILNATNDNNIFSGFKQGFERICDFIKKHPTHERIQKKDLTEPFIRFLNRQIIVPEEFKNCLIECSNQVSEIILHLAKINYHLDYEKVKTLSILEQEFELMNQSSIIDKFKGLTHVYIVNQNLREVPDWLKNYPQITYLCLDDNNISDLPLDFADWLPNLERLIIKNNQFTTYPSALHKMQKTFVIPTMDYEQKILKTIHHLIAKYSNEGKTASEIKQTELDTIIREEYFGKLKKTPFDLFSLILNRDRFKKEIALYLSTFLREEDVNIHPQVNGHTNFNRPFTLIDDYLHLPKDVREKEDPYPHRIYTKLKLLTRGYKSKSPKDYMESPSGKVYELNKQERNRNSIIVYFHGNVSHTNIMKKINMPFQSLKYLTCRGNLMMTRYQSILLNNLCGDNQYDTYEEPVYIDERNGKRFVKIYDMNLQMSFSRDNDAHMGVYLCNGGQLEPIFDPRKHTAPIGILIEHGMMITTLSVMINYIPKLLKGYPLEQYDIIVFACRGYEGNPKPPLYYAKYAHRPRQKSRRRSRSSSLPNKSRKNKKTRKSL